MLKTCLEREICAGFYVNFYDFSLSFLIYGSFNPNITKLFDCDRLVIDEKNYLNSFRWVSLSVYLEQKNMFGWPSYEHEQENKITP